MAGKYTLLTAALSAASAASQDTFEMSFASIANLVGGLPPSGEVRQWWANTSHSQALAWRAPGSHVDQVHLDRRWVRFARGVDGGGDRDSGRSAQRRTRTSTIIREPTGGTVDTRVRMRWHKAGPVALDGLGKVSFGPLETAPGVYRLTLTGGVTGKRPRVYIGETQNLRRQLVGNYRNPGAAQQTNVRIGRLLVEHLSAGGAVELAVSTAATIVRADGSECGLDLNRSASRLLVENAALVLAQLADGGEIVNLE